MSTINKFMSPAPLTISMSATLEQAEKIFVENRITALPVVDTKDNIIGVLTDFILVKMFLRRAKMKTANRSGLNIQFFEDELDPVMTLEETEPLTNAFQLMVQSPNHRVFATQNGKLSGALSPKDIIPFLAGDTERPMAGPSKDLIEAQQRINDLIKQLEIERGLTRNYADFFDNAPFMMHAVDFSGKIVMANKMIHMVLGYEPGELVGLSFTDIYPQNLRNQVQEALFLIKSTGYNPLVASMMVRKDKSLVKVDVASMLRRENGVPVSTISVSRPSELGNMLDYLRMASGSGGL